MTTEMVQKKESKSIAMIVAHFFLPSKSPVSGLSQFSNVMTRGIWMDIELYHLCLDGCLFVKGYVSRASVKTNFPRLDTDSAVSKIPCITVLDSVVWIVQH